MATPRFEEPVVLECKSIPFPNGWDYKKVTTPALYEKVELAQLSETLSATYSLHADRIQVSDSTGETVIISCNQNPKVVVPIPNMDEEFAIVSKRKIEIRDCSQLQQVTKVKREKEFKLPEKTNIADIRQAELSRDLRYVLIILEFLQAESLSNEFVSNSILVFDLKTSALLQADLPRGICLQDFDMISSKQLMLRMREFGDDRTGVWICDIDIEQNKLTMPQKPIQADFGKCIKFKTWPGHCVTISETAGGTFPHTVCSWLLVNNQAVSCMPIGRMNYRTSHDFQAFQTTCVFLSDKGLTEIDLEKSTQTYFQRAVFSLAMPTLVNPQHVFCTFPGPRLGISGYTRYDVSNVEFILIYDLNSVAKIHDQNAAVQEKHVNQAFATMGVLIPRGVVSIIELFARDRYAKSVVMKKPDVPALPSPTNAS